MINMKICKKKEEKNGVAIRMECVKRNTQFQYAKLSHEKVSLKLSWRIFFYLPPSPLMGSPYHHRDPIRRLDLRLSAILVVLHENSVVRIACPSCDTATAVTTYWRPGQAPAFTTDLPASSPVCCEPMARQELRVTYNNFPPFFNMKDEAALDMDGFDSVPLGTFIQKYRPPVSFIDAKVVFGNLDRQTGLWTGNVGNV